MINNTDNMDEHEQEHEQEQEDDGYDNWVSKVGKQLENELDWYFMRYPCEQIEQKNNIGGMSFVDLSMLYKWKQEKDDNLIIITIDTDVDVTHQINVKRLLDEMAFFLKERISLLKSKNYNYIIIISDSEDNFIANVDNEMIIKYKLSCFDNLITECDENQVALKLFYAANVTNKKRQIYTNSWWIK